MTGKQSMLANSRIPQLVVLALIATFCASLVASNMAPDVFQASAFTQTSRHGVVVALTFISFFFLLGHKGIAPFLRFPFVLFAILTFCLLFIVSAKLFFGAEIAASDFYLALGPLLTLLGAFAIVQFLPPRIFFYCLIFFLITFLLIGAAYSISAGGDVWTHRYGRPRLLLGFAHPGKLSQHLGLLVISVVFVALAFRHALFVRLALYTTAFILLGLIQLTGSRTTMVIMSYFVLSFIVGRMRYGSILFLFLSVLLFVVIALVPAALSFDYSNLSALTSGRLVLWLSTIDANVAEYGSSLFLFGANGPPVLGYILDSWYVDTTIAAVRFDNGFLEYLVYYGAAGLALALACLASLFRSTSRGNLMGKTLLVTGVLFLLTESGLFAVGNSFGFLLIVFVLYAVVLYRVQECRRLGTIGLSGGYVTQFARSAW